MADGQPSDSVRLANLGHMKVSELSRRSGVSVFRLRHYESLGLIHAERTSSGYREFAELTLREVIFIAMSRDLGFPLNEIAEILPRYRVGTLTFDQMIDVIESRVAEVDREIAVLGETRRKLVEHVDWLMQKKRESEARRKQPKSRTAWVSGASPSKVRPKAKVTR